MIEETYVTHFWRSHNFRLEPWGNDYEPPIQISEELSLTESDVNPTVETDNWDCFESQAPRSLPHRLIFTDGRRRLDAALVGGNGNTIIYGVFGTIAVGAVVVNRTIPQANYLEIEREIELQRVVGFGGEQEAVSTHIPCPLGSKAKLFYKAITKKFENNPEVRRVIVQTAMLEAEEQLVGKLDVKDADTLVIRDGSLRYESPVFALGYIKTMHKQYLPEKYAALLWQLLPGQRTPIFEIKDTSLYSWYLKSGDFQHLPQQLGYHDLHGIVRLELSIKNGIDRAIQIADQTCHLIPYYASHPSRDPRAPQNLAPVSALERELGRRMGDATLIKRRLQNFLASIGGNE